MSGELKPCPFCGGAASLLQKELEEMYVLCHGCGAESNSHRDKGQCAIDEWNTRVGNHWRKYPDVKPEKAGWYLVSDGVICWMGNFIDYSDEVDFHLTKCQNDEFYWTELPLPKKEYQS